MLDRLTHMDNINPVPTSLEKCETLEELQNEYRRLGFHIPMSIKEERRNKLLKIKNKK